MKAKLLEALERKKAQALAVALRTSCNKPKQEQKAQASGNAGDDVVDSGELTGKIRCKVSAKNQ